VHAAGRGICPRCSAAIAYSLDICENHTIEGNRCEECGMRFAGMFSAVCTNCIFDVKAPIVVQLAVQTELMAFMIDHGIDPVSSEGYNFPLGNVIEDIRSTDPFKAEFTFATDEETLTLTVDEELSISGVERNMIDESE
ncbi:MAG: hypothetical protein ABEI86_12505, partial [Halobacteriaceae archaeon]